MSRACALRIDHFEGAYGPTIWLDVEAPGDLASLLSVFRKLANGDAKEVELCTALSTRSENLGELRLCLEERLRLPRKRLVRTRSYERPGLSGPQLPSFVWSNYAGGWKRCAEIVAGMLESGDPARRDLTKEGFDDAVVDLSFRAARAATLAPELGWGASPHRLHLPVKPRFGVAESLVGAIQTFLAQRLARGFRGAS